MNGNISDVLQRAKVDADRKAEQNREELRQERKKWEKHTEDFPRLLPQARDMMNEHKNRIGQWTDGNIVDCWIGDSGFLTVRYESSKRYSYAYDNEGYLVYWEEPYK